MSQHLASWRLRRPRWLALALAAGCLVVGLRLPAQDQGVDPGIAPNTDTRRAAMPGQALNDHDATVTRTGRAALPRPDLRVDPDDPQVDRLLQLWSEHTQRIKYLAGKHLRATRDYAFGVETLAEGKFFVEMPDKGRIDVSTWTQPNPKAGDVKEYTAPDGKSVKLTIKTDDKREKWICDGKIVRVIDDNRKTVEEVPIPPDQQGAHMIDGPLPFLLGMPPEKAKARYRFRIAGRVPPDRIWIEVKPRLPMDAAEWVRANVLLNLRTYLPERVSLFNPAGTTETVYLFKEIDLNEPGMLQKLFTGDPFKPNTWRYHREVHATTTPDGKDFGPGSLRMPLVIGASSNDALRIQKQLKARGFDVEFKKGHRAPTVDQAYHIESQQPEANTPLRPGDKIVLRYYDKVQTVDGQLQ